MLKEKKKKKNKSKIHNNTEQDRDKAKKEQKSRCTLRSVLKHWLRRWIFLNGSVSEIPYPHKIKASIFKVMIGNNEEIVVLNKCYTVFHCPMFSWERCLDLRKELLPIYWKIGAIRTLYTTWKTKYFIHVSCREKNRLVSNSLAVLIWLEEISSAIQKGWNLTKNVSFLQAFKMLNYFFSLLTEYSTYSTLILYIYRNWRP